MTSECACGQTNHHERLPTRCRAPHHEAVTPKNSQMARQSSTNEREGPLGQSRRDVDQVGWGSLAAQGTVEQTLRTTNAQRGQRVVLNATIRQSEWVSAPQSYVVWSACSTADIPPSSPSQSPSRCIAFQIRTVPDEGGHGNSGVGACR